MKALRILIWALLLAMMFLPARTADPDESKWDFSYPLNEGVKSVVVTLSYRWWNPKVDGDLPSKKVLLMTTKVEIKPGQASLPIQVLLNGGKSVMVVGTQLFRGKGFLLDAAYCREASPKPNADGFYVLARKPTDPKDPSGDPSAWIELGIDPQP